MRYGYEIAAGSRIEIRRAGTNRFQIVVTTRRLRFPRVHGTGYGGQVLYFQHGGYEIAVNKSSVTRGDEGQP
jgi:hypothetical protein